MFNVIWIIQRDTQNEMSSLPSVSYNLSIMVFRVPVEDRYLLIQYFALCPTFKVCGFKSVWYRIALIL